VPFVIYSGTSHASAAREFQDVPWIGKPIPMGDLAEALRGRSAPERLPT